MNRNLWLLALCQGLFLTNNVTFIAINGLVGLSLAPYGWMATLPVMGYVVGSALSTPLVARSQDRFGRRASFQIGLFVAIVTATVAAFAVANHQFWVLVAATVTAGYYSANGQLYRFAAAELAKPEQREKAVSLVMAGGLIGAVVGPNLAARSRTLLSTPFSGAYAVLAGIALFAMILMAFIEFPSRPSSKGATAIGRPLGEILVHPVFLVACIGSALGYGVMNLLMAATPLAMQQCGLGFDDVAIVLEWHVIGMFAPGFFTGHLIKRFGTLSIMGVGVMLNIICIAIALSGIELQQFVVALLLLGVGWNFLFTGATTLALRSYRPEEKDRAQAIINFCVFSVSALTSFTSGAMVTTKGWSILNWGGLFPLGVIGLALVWLAQYQRSRRSSS